MEALMDISPQPLRCDARLLSRLPDLPPARPCSAELRCQGNNDSWCDLTSNASLNLRKWNKWSGSAADVSKSFYKDKSTGGFSCVHIFITVSVTQKKRLVGVYISLSHKLPLMLLTPPQSDCHRQPLQKSDMTKEKEMITDDKKRGRWIKSDFLWFKPLTKICKLINEWINENHLKTDTSGALEQSTSMLFFKSIGLQGTS